MRNIGPATAGWMMGLALLAWGVTEGVAVAEAQYPRRPARTVVHQYRHGPLQHQFLFEGALAIPYGDLSDDYFTTSQGLSQESGFELGARYRYFLAPWLAVSPAFHYVDFGADKGVADFGSAGSDLGYVLSTAIYRYSVDLQSFVGDPEAVMRPYLTLGLALSHHTYEEEVEGDWPYKAGSTGLAFSGGVGLQFGPVEVSAVYVLDRFETDALPTARGEDDWDWDHLLVRAGISLGRF
ncbi:MAG: hypothetical protein R6X25_15110 [Candidatus Krumholzibacteriia bacterium]